LNADGTVAAWGNNRWGQAIVPVGLTNVVAIAGCLNTYSSLALVGDGPPFISSAVMNITVALGTTAFLRAEAAGKAPLSWQWRFNDTELSGATNAILPLTDAQFTQTGSYSVVVSNTLGSAASANLEVTVVPLLISTQPQSQSAALGSTVIFDAPVTTTLPASYQWQWNGTELAGATTPSLVLPNVGFAQSGVYTMTASNALGTVQSADALLNVGLISAWGESSQAETTLPPGLTNVVSIAAGPTHSLALLANGGVIAWGENSYGKIRVPPGLQDVVAVAAGKFHSVALKSDGTVTAWGNNSFNETTIPTGLADVVSVATTGPHTLALTRQGTLAAWGYDAFGQCQVPSDRAVAIAAGEYHCLAIKPDGTVIGWGWNANGQAAPPLDLTNAVAIAAAGNHSLALKADGKVVAWGNNSYGQSNVPKTLSNVVAIACGANHSLALRADGTVVAWGYNFSGQSAVPAGLAKVVAIAGGGAFSLGLVGDGPPFLATSLVSRRVVCGSTARLGIQATGSLPLNYQWRLNGTNLPGSTNALLVLSNVKPEQVGMYSVVVSNDFGVLYSRDMTLDLDPLLLVGQPQIQSTFLGGSAMFQVEAAFLGPFAYQWQFNDRDLEGATNSALLLTNVQWSQAGSYGVTVENAVGAIRSTNTTLSIGRVALWGSKSDGDLDIPPNLTNVLAIAAGSSHGLALQTDNTVTAWGNNRWGQARVPAGLTNVTAVAGGGWHSLALRSDGTVAGWGYNTWRQATPPPNLTNALAIAGGLYHSLALRSDGTVLGWGLGANGQTSAPGSLTNAVAVTAGGYHSLALRSDGTVAAWGLNADAQTTVPSDLTNVVDVAAGGFHSLALRADGTVVAWGLNTSGQNDVPIDLTNAVAIAAGGFHSLALKVDGTVIGWGSDTRGEIEHPSGLPEVMAIAAGYNHSLALIRSGGFAQNLRFDNSPGAMRIAASGFRLRLTGVTDLRPVVLDTSVDLLNWVPLFTNPPMLRSFEFIDRSAETSANRFYRARQE
jgi:alpha-tubulin suppressor-like RCC1 family protein